MSQLNVNAFQHTNGTNAITFANPRMEPSRLVIPNVTDATLPPVSQTIPGEMYFNSTDKRLYISDGTNYSTKSSFTTPSGTFSYAWTSTSQNGTSQPAPINIYFRRNIFQTVYTTDELLNNGVEDGAIFRNLKWNITGAVPANNSILGFTLRLFHTTTTNGQTLAGPITGESKTTVYSDTSSTEFTLVESTGIKTITFGGGNNTGVTRSSTFEWNGIDNICVESCMSQNQTNWTSAGQQRIISFSSGSRYSWTDSTGNSCNDNPSGVVSYKPAVQMDFF